MVRSPAPRQLWIGKKDPRNAIIHGGPAVIVIRCKKGESVIISDDIILTVIDVRGDKVRLGIEHPKGVTVHRREIYEAIRSQQEVGQGD
jgi:carbon storage regulator